MSCPQAGRSTGVPPIDGGRNGPVRPHGTPLAVFREPQTDRERPPVIDDHSSDDIRALFDWRSASLDGGQTGSSPVPTTTSRWR
jgi:hypothetical protein